MRKVILSNLVTLDGYFAGPNGELDWQIVDGENKEYANDLLSNVDALLFGRLTYQLMADYWPAGLRAHQLQRAILKLLRR